MMKNIFITLVVSFLCAKESIAKLPSSIPVCSRNDPEINECAKNAINSLKSFIKDGDFGEGYKILPIDPLSIADIKMDRGDNFKANITNFFMNGTSNFNIIDIRVNPSKLRLNAAVIYPKVNFIGKYSLKVKLLIDINGNGNMRGDIDNLRANFRLYGSKYFKDSKEYVKINKLTIHIFVDKFNLKLDNLFNGSKVLGDVGNQLIDDNKNLFFEEIKPVLEKDASQYFLNVANTILKSTTYDEMFPDT